MISHGQTEIEIFCSLLSADDSRLGDVSLGGLCI